MVIMTGVPAYAWRKYRKPVDHMRDDDGDRTGAEYETEDPSDLLIWKFTFRAVCNILLDLLVFCLVVYTSYYAVPALVTAVTELIVITKSLPVPDTLTMA